MSFNFNNFNSINSFNTKTNKKSKNNIFLLVFFLLILGVWFIFFQNIRTD